MTKKRLFVLLSIMVRYGILVFAAVSRRDLRERVAQPGPSRDTAPVGLRRTGCTALPRLFQANGMNSVLRSTYPPYAIFGPRLNNHGFGPHAAFGAGKTGRFLQKGVVTAVKKWTSTVWTKNFNHAFGGNVWQQADRQAMCGRPNVSLQGDRPGAATYPPTYLPAIRCAGNKLNCLWLTADRYGILFFDNLLSTLSQANARARSRGSKREAAPVRTSRRHRRASA